MRSSESAWFVETEPEAVLEDEQPLWRRRSRSRSAVKWGIAVMMVAVLCTTGWVGYSLYRSFGNLFGGNIFSAILGPGAPLRVDGYGNTNVLMLGTSENDPSRGGPLLTDSMMVFSINQTTHHIVLLSIPRDLWVTHGNTMRGGRCGQGQRGLRMRTGRRRRVER